MSMLAIFISLYLCCYENDWKQKPHCKQNPQKARTVNMLCKIITDGGFGGCSLPAANSQYDFVLQEWLVPHY